MRERACRAVKIIGLVREYFKAPFPQGWDESEQIESFGKLVQSIEDLMLAPPNKANAADSEFEAVVEGIEYKMEYVSAGVIRLNRCR